ncbi:hypothetical protein CDAR_555291 [Caerostris darwini]|uniref:Uncharacterized protein n=1 Tax=Caerostris darwini TaxID=1538125 RepID=A0AAV4RGQ9_9ARAC|nr:hypothetical protein CDAR_555291 [Caerostris darwini]
MGIGKYRRIPAVEEAVLQTIEDNPATSTRAVECVLGQVAANTTFLVDILFTDEDTFSQSESSKLSFARIGINVARTLSICPFPLGIPVAI